jgi:hypothetical protein
MKSGAPDTDTYLGLVYYRLGNGRPKDLESQQGPNAPRGLEVWGSRSCPLSFHNFTGEIWG